MPKQQTLVLDPTAIKQKIERLAYQIYEDCVDDRRIFIAGIDGNGYLLAKSIAALLRKICSVEIVLLKISLDKKNPFKKPAEILPAIESFKNESIVVVDDVLNSGKTMMHALMAFLSHNPGKIRTLVLARRSHNLLPVSADFTGISIATTLQDHISVELEYGKEAVYLE